VRALGETNYAIAGITHRLILQVKSSQSIHQISRHIIPFKLFMICGELQPSVSPRGPVSPYGHLVRSLAFPGLQASLVPSSSPFIFPIRPCTQRTQLSGTSTKTKSSLPMVHHPVGAVLDLLGGAAERVAL
jgi:hypothetical protein